MKNPADRPPLEAVTTGDGGRRGRLDHRRAIALGTAQE